MPCVSGHINGLECIVDAPADLLTRKSEVFGRKRDVLLDDACNKLREDLNGIAGTGEDGARYYRQVIAKDMDDLRKIADDLEIITDKSYWPFPTYSDILFY